MKEPCRDQDATDDLDTLAGARYSTGGFGGLDALDRREGGLDTLAGARYSTGVREGLDTLAGARYSTGVRGVSTRSLALATRPA